jgi:hypothetical protein
VLGVLDDYLTLIFWLVALAALTQIGGYRLRLFTASGWWALGNASLKNGSTGCGFLQPVLTAPCINRSADSYFSE